MTAHYRCLVADLRSAYWLEASGATGGAAGSCPFSHGPVPRAENLAPKTPPWTGLPPTLRRLMFLKMDWPNSAWLATPINGRALGTRPSMWRRSPRPVVGQRRSRSASRASLGTPSLPPHLRRPTAELADIRYLFSSFGLITLTGPGGSGKTRLALRAAAELSDGVGDGAWFIDLAPVPRPRQRPGHPGAHPRHWVPGRPVVA